jgi:hypothetical protein
VLLETQEPLVLKAYRVFRAIQGLLVLQATLVHKEIQDQQAQLVQQALQALLVQLAQEIKLV